MGYTTDFTGEFACSPALRPEHAAYLRKFNKTRRMKRDSSLAGRLEDPVRKAVKLKVGVEGAYFVGGLGFMGQGDDRSVVNHNGPPEGQPGLWCQWTPNENGTAIIWDGGEKFYEYVEWLQYIIDNFLKPWGYTLTGDMQWQGEDQADRGVIHVVNNEITAEEDPNAGDAGIPDIFDDISPVEEEEEQAQEETGAGFTDRDIAIIQFAVGQMSDQVNRGIDRRATVEEMQQLKDKLGI